MIEFDKKSTNKNNKSKAQARAEIQEQAVEEFLFLIQQPLFNNVLKKPDEKTRLIKHPVSTNKKKKEPDYAIIYPDKNGKKNHPVIVEVKSSLNSTKKVDEIISKYMNTSYLNRKTNHLIVFSFSTVPQKVIDKIKRVGSRNKNFKIHLVTPEMMKEVLEKNKKIPVKMLKKKNETRLENIQEERKKFLKNFEQFIQKKYKIEGFEKSFLTARDIASRNQKQAEGRELHKIQKVSIKKQKGKINKKRGRRH